MRTAGTARDCSSDRLRTMAGTNEVESRLVDFVERIALLGKDIHILEGETQVNVPAQRLRKTLKIKSRLLAVRKTAVLHEPAGTGIESPIIIAEIVRRHVGGDLSTLDEKIDTGGRGGFTWQAN